MAYEIATIGDLAGMGTCCEACAHGGTCPGAMGELPTSEAAQLVSAGLIPSIVWPSDVDAYKARIDPDFRSTESAASRCANLSNQEAIAWGDFYTTWRKFADTPTAIVSSWETQLQQAKDFESKLRDWQAQLSKTCQLVAPPVAPKAGPSAIVYLVGGVAVLGLAAVIYSFYKTSRVVGARAQAGQRYLEDRVVPRALAR